jgi:outer membrane immunogenic protein
MKRLSLGVVVIAALGFAAGPVSAADMPVKAPPPMVMPALYNWSGVYIGVEGGAVMGQHTDWRKTHPVDTLDAQDFGHPVHGGFVGGEAGFNWQSGRWVFGIEGDGSWAEIEESLADPHSPTFFVGSRIRDFETIRGRIGYAFGPTGSFLVYVTAGGAFANQARIEGRLITPIPPDVVQWKRTDGWTVGGGAEYGITPWLTLKGEVLYIDLARRDYAEFDNGFFTASEANIKTNFVLARMGLNWLFNWGKGKGPAPVVAS